MMAIFFDLVKKVMEVFMDDFSVYDKTFEDCLANLNKVLKRCQMADLILNWADVYRLPEAQQSYSKRSFPTTLH
jgi:hypothetical protein